MVEKTTASILAEALGVGMKIVSNVPGPIDDMKVMGGYGIVPHEKTAIVETAVAELDVLTIEELEPMKSSTFGTGVLLQDTLKAATKKVSYVRRLSDK